MDFNKKSIELLNLYAEKISKLVDATPDQICFYINGKRVLNEFGYYKSESEAKTYARDTGIEFNMDDYIFVKDNWKLGKFEVKIHRPAKGMYSSISTFELYELPHCCAFCVSCKAFVAKSFRKKGIGTLLNLFRIDLAKYLGYSSIMCTDIEQNTCQRKLLKKNGWEDVYSVKNKRTTNNVFLTIKNLL